MSGFCFYGVGQGLFYSGMIENGDKRFSFVYDCGSSGDKANLYRCIDEYIETLPKGNGGKKHLDMLILSHFHRDHINGLEYFLERVEVSLAVIPYNPDEYLTLFALDSRVAEEPDDFILDFLSDRFSFLKAHGVKTVIELCGKTEIDKDTPNLKFADGGNLTVYGASRVSEERYLIDFDAFRFRLSLDGLSWLFSFRQTKEETSSAKAFLDSKCIGNVESVRALTEREEILRINKAAEVFIPVLNRSSLMCFHYPEDEPSKGSFLTGDVPLMDEWEQQLFPAGLNAGNEIYCYQVPHHGAKEVYPHHIKAQNYLVSVGEHNIYGHPDIDTMLKLSDSFELMTILNENDNFRYSL
jgi:Predicted hydrolase (metallo-beta-lactamase superfamily)